MVREEVGGGAPLPCSQQVLVDLDIAMPAPAHQCTIRFNNGRLGALQLNS